MTTVESLREITLTLKSVQLVLIFLFVFGVKTTLSQNPTIVFEQPINKIEGGGIPDLNNGDWFGYGFAPIGDLDQDGVMDIAVGAPYDDTGGLNRGALYILFMNANGTVGSYQKISQSEGGFQGLLVDESFFGSEIANLGDLDNNGVQDLVVGASGDDDGGSWAGALWVLFMNADGTVADEQKISALEGWSGSPLVAGDRFGKGLDSIGDINNDGVIDVMVGAHEDDEGGYNHGAAYVLLLNSDGTVLSHSKISEATAGFSGVLTNSANFGWSVACLGDMNSDGNTEILVSAMQDDVLSSNDGSVWVISVTTTGDLSNSIEISAGTSTILANAIGAGDKFGSSVTRGFNMWCDNASDIIVGLMNYGNPQVGGVFLLNLDSNYQVLGIQVITEGMANFQDNLNTNDKFGRALHLMTDYDGNGYPDLMVGAMNFDAGGPDVGGTWLLSLDRASSISVLQDTLLVCGGTAIELYPSLSVDDIVWSTGETTDTIVIASAGQVWLEGFQGECAIVDTVEVLSLSIPEPNLGQDTVVCDELLLEVSFPDYINYWSTGAIGQTTLITQTGEYWVTLSGDCGDYTDSIYVQVLESIAFSLGNDTMICNGEQVSIMPNTNWEGVIDFVWSDGSGDTTLVVGETGEYWIEANTHCGSISDTLSLSTSSGPVFSLGSDTAVCNSLVQLAPSGEFFLTTVFNWNTGNTTSSVVTDSSGLYILRATDVCGVYEDSVSVHFIDSSIYITLPEHLFICTDDTIVITADVSDMNAEVIWNTSESGRSIFVSDAGLYVASVQGQCNNDSDTSLVYLLEQNPIYTSLEYSACGSIATLSIDSVNHFTDWLTPLQSSFLWSNGATDTSITVFESGVYWLKETSYCGEDTAFVQVELSDCWTSSIPNVITPNGDGVNDVFVPYAEECGICPYQLRVYNRWGVLLFDEKDAFWDGTLKTGRAAEPGVYYYIMQMEESVNTGYLEVLP